MRAVHKSAQRVPGLAQVVQGLMHSWNEARIAALFVASIKQTQAACSSLGAFLPVGSYFRSFVVGSMFKRSGGCSWFSQCPNVREVCVNNGGKGADRSLVS